MADKVSKLTSRVRRQLKATDAQIEAFLVRLERFLDLNLDEIVGKINAGERTGADAARIIGSMFTELEARGLSAEVGRLRKVFAEELRFIRDEFQESDFDEAIKADADGETINALINNSLDQVANQITGYGLNIQSAVMQSVLTGQEPNYKQLKQEFGEGAARNIKTEIDTAVMTFNRTVTVNKSIELGFELFIYIGPEDSVTRDFCRGVLKKDPPIYTIDEINSMDNDQGLPVFSSGGGYNCRHQWRPISLEDATARGYKPT